MSAELRTSPKKIYDTALPSGEPPNGFSPDPSARPRQPESWLGIIPTATVGTGRSAPGAVQHAPPVLPAECRSIVLRVPRGSRTLTDSRFTRLKREKGEKGDGRIYWDVCVSDCHKHRPKLPSICACPLYPSAPVPFILPTCQSITYPLLC